jgi:hypothetical protein
MNISQGERGGNGVKPTVVNQWFLSGGWISDQIEAYFGGSEGVDDARASGVYARRIIPEV